jgi:hypothetical protein
MYNLIIAALDSTSAASTTANSKASTRARRCKHREYARRWHHSHAH